VSKAVKQVTVFFFSGFLLLIFLQSLFRFVPDPTLLEKRQLARLPEFSLAAIANDNFTRRADLYANDNFGFRKAFIRLNNLIDVRLFYTPSNFYVLDGHDGFLFGKSDWDAATHRHSEVNDETMQLTANRIKAFQDRLDRRGIAFILLIAPSKGSVYAEKLPAKPYLINEISERERWTTAYRQAGVRYIDPTSLLLENKKMGLLYYKGDHHWNRFAGLLATKLIADKLAPIVKREAPTIRVNGSRPDDWESFGGGSLDEHLGIKANRINQAPNFEVTSGSLPDALVMGDSFIRWLELGKMSQRVFNIEKIAVPPEDFEKTLTAHPDIGIVVIHVWDLNLAPLANSSIWDSRF
jgi:hypothetical protein